MKATLTPGCDVQFNNLDHLTQLDAEDYFAIRLHQNTDSENMLWEYAFGEVKLVTPEGNPVTQPIDNGDGQNEFTFDSSTPGKLVINFKCCGNSRA